jgi:PDZ domain-containing secreted protein
VVNVEVARKGGQRVTLRVPLQHVSATAAQGSRSHDDSSNGGDNGTAMHALGASVSTVDAATARQLQLPSDAAHGVLVTGVQEGSSAASHLATPDNGGPDVILSVEGTAVHTPEEMRSALSHAKTGDIVSLRVYNVPAKTRRVERLRLGGE